MEFVLKKKQNIYSLIKENITQCYTYVPTRETYTINNIACSLHFTYGLRIYPSLENLSSIAPTPPIPFQANNQSMFPSMFLHLCSAVLPFLYIRE